MAALLVVKVVDVNLGDVDGAKAEVAFGSAAALTPLTPVAGQPGVHEVAIPEHEATLTVQVSKDGFFPARQVLRIAGSGAQASLKYVDGQAINTLKLTAHTRDGSKRSLEVTFVLGQLRDVTAKVHAEFARLLPASSLALTARDALSWSEPLLQVPSSPQGLQPNEADDRLNRSRVPVTPTGKLLFFERPVLPSLIGVHQPDGFPAESGALPFVVGFHPSPGFMPTAYPYEPSYLDLAGRYLLYEKSWVYQCAEPGPKAFFVLPVGYSRKGMGDLATQQGLLRLLQELTYILQRMAGQRQPKNTLGAVGLTGYSWGGGRVMEVLTGARQPEFFDQHLRHVWSLDGIYVKEEGGPSRAVRALKAWYRGGQDKRTLRLYVQDGTWHGLLASQFGGAALGGTTTSADGGKELRSASHTVLTVPVPFWKKQGYKTVDYYTIHHHIAETFLSHAVRNADFT